MKAERTLEQQRINDNAGTSGPASFAQAVIAERDYQTRKWGATGDRHHTLAEWSLILTKEFGEAVAEIFELTWPRTDEERAEIIRNLRNELVQVAAVCSAIAEQLPQPDAKGASER